MTRSVRWLGTGLIAALLGSSAVAEAGTIQTSFCSAGTPVSAWAPINGPDTPGHLFTPPGGNSFLLTQVCSGLTKGKGGFSIETNDCCTGGPPCAPAGCTMTVEVAGGFKPSGGNPRCTQYDPGIKFPGGLAIQARDNNSVAIGGVKVTVTGLLCPP